MNKPGVLGLSRQVGQAIIMVTGTGERIEIMVDAITGSGGQRFDNLNARVRIVAPLSVRIVRAELAVKE